jgi:hypothetical protein
MNGQGGIMFHYDGIAWSEMDSGTTDHQYGMWGNDNRVYSVGFNGSILYLNLNQPPILIAGLGLFIMDEVDSGNIAPELEGSLLVKIDAALAALDRGNPNDAKVAMNDLKALINQVEAQIDKKITPEAAAEIIQQANATIAALGG